MEELELDEPVEEEDPEAFALDVALLDPIDAVLADEAAELAPFRVEGSTATMPAMM